MNAPATGSHTFCICSLLGFELKNQEYCEGTHQESEAGIGVWSSCNQVGLESISAEAISLITGGGVTSAIP
ncbi:hypothetical protein F2Q70_00008433 [Brassica cretica]|uniref:Uncharacterized protein n=2 Tax=Brassica cretica TaxID=69181 RepID=A0A8S9M407_BRACR|nr:hypothetical protein F2Q70_00008433 [Brassica cretica]KAF3510018.1 hypothetical protein F2Q69_00001747 [Brassica cretica]KAF3543131.1 hypothetical protein DY000_02001928 [Brassica cretica]